MNISLTPELEQFITDRVKSGMYNSSSEVVREALRLLKEQHELYRIRLAELKTEIDKGVASANAGRLISGDEAFKRVREQIKKHRNAVD